jgi:hypothetical protein
MRHLEAARHAAERKRLVYVAATRAREELHLFAIPHLDSKGRPAATANSLLQAAWHAASLHIAPASAPVLTLPLPATEETFDLAATAEASPAPPLETPTPLLRLPRNLIHSPGALPPRVHDTPAIGRGLRPEDGLSARALGNAIHAFLERIARDLAAATPPASILDTLRGRLPRIAAILRAEGLAPAMVERLAERTLTALEQTLRDPVGQWLLAPHPGAATEQALTTWSDRRLGLRLDRTFQAGPEPLAPGNACNWVIDFKTTTHGPEGLAAFLEQERARYAAPMQAYARALGSTETRLMLFYPLIPTHTWWLARSTEA